MSSEGQAPLARQAPLAILVIAVLLMAGCARDRAPVAEFRVCADPNNLPFSNDRGEGFENRLAELIAGDLNARVTYTWWAQRRGFVRNTLRAGECDAIMGVPVDYDPVRTTQPYYRSTYVFVSPTARRLAVHSFDDALLRTLRVGVHTIGDDYANAPPAHALARRQIITNVVGYSIYGNYTDPNPPARLIEAVAQGTIDMAIVWGPLGGYFASRQPVPLSVVPSSVAIDPPDLPMAFDIAMGVRRDDAALQARLDEILQRRAAEVESLLREYGVPLLPRAAPAQAREVR
jgi:mxaJ protein